MKKKKWLIPVVVIVAILVLSVAAVFLGGNQFTVARCIVTDNDSLYMVYEDNQMKQSDREQHTTSVIAI